MTALERQAKYTDYINDTTHIISKLNTASKELLKTVPGTAKFTKCYKNARSILEELIWLVQTVPLQACIEATDVNMATEEYDLEDVRFVVCGGKSYHLPEWKVSFKALNSLRIDVLGWMRDKTFDVDGCVWFIS